MGGETAIPETRVALVIGNGNYSHAPKLRNPVADAALMKDVFGQLNFKVLSGKDLSVAQMDSLLAQFSDELETADTAVFYYAGHGLQVDGENYLVPIDAALSNVGQLTRQTVKLKDQLTMMSEKADVCLIFLDCCRDNPFTRSLHSSRQSKARSVAVSRGMADIETQDGSLIAFATGPGSVASDGDGLNSPFTTAVARHIVTRGMSITDVLTEVTATVRSETDHYQGPWFHSSLQKIIVLNPIVAPMEITTKPPLGSDSETDTKPKQEIDGLGTEGNSKRGNKEFGPTGLMMKYVLVGLIILFSIVVVYWVNNILDPEALCDRNAPARALSCKINLLENSRVKKNVFSADLEIGQALSGTNFSVSDKAVVVGALLNAAKPDKLIDMSDEGRFKLFKLISDLPSSLWLEPQMLELLEESHQLLAELDARLKADLVIRESTLVMLLPWEAHSGYVPRKDIKVFVQFADFSRSDIDDVRWALIRGWGWTGTQGIERIGTAHGLSEVRYSSGDMEASAKLLAAQLNLSIKPRPRSEIPWDAATIDSAIRSAGLPLVAVRRNPAIGVRNLEVWIGK